MVEVDRLRANWHLSQARPQQAIEAAEAARTSAKQLGALLAELLGMKSASKQRPRMD